MKVWKGILIVLLIVAIICVINATANKCKQELNEKDNMLSLIYKKYGVDLRNKTVFIENCINLTSLQSLMTTKSIEEADIVILSSDTKVSRLDFIKALNSNKPVIFVGKDAEDCLIAMLYGVDKDRVKMLIDENKLRKPKDLKFTFGFEFSNRKDDYIAIAYPNGNALEIHVYFTDAPTEEYILNCIAKTLSLTFTASLSYPYWSSDQWAYLGTFHVEDEYEPYGKVEYFVYGYKAKDGNSNEDFYGWEIRQVIQPGCSVDEWNSDWQNEWIFRKMDFPNDDYEIIDYGPEDTQGISTVTVSIGISASDTEIGASIGSSWSYSVSDVQVIAHSDVTEEYVWWKHLIATGSTSATTDYVGRPGVIVSVPQGTSPATYQHETDFRWILDGWLWDDHHTVQYAGNGYWYG